MSRHLLLWSFTASLLAACVGGSVGEAPGALKGASKNGDPGGADEQLGLVDLDASQTNVIDRYVVARLARLGIEPHYASDPELIRRMAIDLTGTVPDKVDYSALAGADASEMADYFMANDAYVEVSQVIYADILSFSNDASQFSTQSQVESLNDLVRDAHLGKVAYDEFARQVLLHPAFLSRFNSPADRATASMTIFIGYDPVTAYDFSFGNMFRGYELTNEATREHTWTGTCDDIDTDETEVCSAELWGTSGATPEEAGQMLTAQAAFAEHSAAAVWKRYIGSGMDPALPELAVALGEWFEESGYSLPALTKEIVTSAAYRQSFSYRDKELVQQ